MKKILLILFLLPQILFSQIDTTEKSLVNWLTIEKAEELNKTNPKPFLIDVYTHWCGWCKYMMSTTYSNPNIAGYINNNFYPVQIDAETSDTLTYQGKKYTKSGKTNTLAVELLNGRLSYPSTVFISKNNQKIPVPGYLETKDIEPFLVYFAEDLINSVDFNDFHAAYMFRYPKNYKENIDKLTAEQKLDTLGIPVWDTFETALENNKKNPKKFILFSYVDWCYSCKIMEKITFSNSIIANKINSNFYLISFNAATEQSLNINGKTYKSLGKGMPNELAMELFQKQFFFPSVIFLDENFQLITVVRGYMTAKSIEPVLDYFSSNSFKTTQYQDFIKTFESKIK